jgi:hypothetical protein
MATSVVGRHVRPRYCRLRRTGSGFQPWSRRRRACPINVYPLGVTEQVAPRVRRRPSPPTYELG